MRINDKTVHKMRERHKKEIAAFQAKCKHYVLSGWIEEYWAPGHSTGEQVRICRVCEKVVEREE